MGNFELNRRKAIQAVGLGSLAACAKLDESDADSPRGAFLKSGRPALYGVNPNIPHMPNGLPSGLPTFNPAYLTLIRVSASHGWGFDVNHASFAYSGPNAPEPDSSNARADQAIALFRQTINGPARRRFSQIALPPGASIYPRTKPPYQNQTDVPSLDRIGANHPAEIFIWYDNPRIEIYNDYFISFTTFSSEGVVRAPNDSFFASRVIQTILPGPMIRIRNYFCDYEEIGDTDVFTTRKPDSPERIYSMNLHIKVPDTGNRTIPLIIDPDTGSGAGWEP